MTNVSRNKREKYGQINITWWENTNLSGDNWWGIRFAYWWLTDVISFKAGDEPIKIPVESSRTGADGEQEIKAIYTKIDDFDDPQFASTSYGLRNFPRIGTYDSWHAEGFYISIFGEEDKINVSKSEFYNAGGSARIEWDVEEYQYCVVIQPPLDNIGTNENFSITLEGSIPALFLKQPGKTLSKRTTTFYTEFYGKTNSVLDLELEHVTEKEFLYNSAQKLLEKYSYGNTTFSVEYFQEDMPVIDNKRLIPQSVTIDSSGKRSTNDAFIYNSLDSIPEKPLSELGSSEHTLDDVQFYPLAFLS